MTAHSKLGYEDKAFLYSAGSMAFYFMLLLGMLDPTMPVLPRLCSTLAGFLCSLSAVVYTIKAGLKIAPKTVHTGASGAYLDLWDPSSKYPRSKLTEEEIGASMQRMGNHGLHSQFRGPQEELVLDTDAPPAIAVVPSVPDARLVHFIDVSSTHWNDDLPMTVLCGKLIRGGILKDYFSGGKSIVTCPDCLMKLAAKEKR